MAPKPQLISTDWSCGEIQEESSVPLKLGAANCLTCQRSQDDTKVFSKLSVHHTDPMTVRLIQSHEAGPIRPSCSKL